LAQKTKPGRYAVGHGAYLQISKWGTRAWLFRYHINGVGHGLGLGSCTYVTLAEARQKAFELRRQIAAGVDPLTAKRAAEHAQMRATASSRTFRECALSYIKTREGRWRTGHSRKQWLFSLEKYVFPRIGNLGIADVDATAVAAVLDPIAQQIPETALRVRNRMALILDWAAARNMRPTNNPAKQRELVEIHKKAPVHLPAMHYRDIPAFLAELREKTHLAARVIEFQVLTATRPSEALEARWDEIDGDVWLIPAARTKGGTPHRVPLSKRAIELLAGMARTGDRIFACTNRPVRDILKRHGITAHGFRSSFRTWAEEQTAYPHAVVEAALGHKIPNAVERAYQRSDLIEKRKQLMQLWSDYCSKPVAKTGEIIPLRA